MSFIAAVFSSIAQGYPVFIGAKIINDHFILTVEGEYLDINDSAWEQLGQFLKIEGWQQLLPPDIPWGLSCLRPIVWFTDYCLVDIRNVKGLHRQAFLQGSPIGQSLTLPDSYDPKTRITLCFTLRSNVFEDSRLEMNSLKQAVSRWRKTFFASEIPTGTRVPNLRLKWNKRSSYIYDLEITADYD